KALNAAVLRRQRIVGFIPRFPFPPRTSPRARHRVQNLDAARDSTQLPKSGGAVVLRRSAPCPVHLPEGQAHRAAQAECPFYGCAVPCLLLPDNYANPISSRVG